MHSQTPTRFYAQEPARSGQSLSLIGRLLIVTVVAILIVACSQSEQQNAGTAPASPKPPSIDVSPVITETIIDWDIHSGRLQAPETVVLVPRVSGYIEQVHFQEGALVQAGEVLFQIDSRPFQAEVDRLKAELRSARSVYELASKDYDRAERLQQQGAISNEVADNRQSAKQQALAQMLAVQAALDRAQLDLEYTHLKAPISGRLSYAQVTKGNYVSAGQTRLTTLVSTERMYAYFDVDEASYLDFSQRLRAASEAAAGSLLPPVYLGLANESGYPHSGQIDFIDNSVNEQTGTIRLRATFDNAEGQLLPGLYSRLKLAASEPYEAVLINDKAVGTDLNNKFVLVLNEQNVVEYRAVTLGELNQGLRVVNSGLKAGDTIVVNGLQRIYPNTEIDPNIVPMASEEALAQLRQANELKSPEGVAAHGVAEHSVAGGNTTATAAVNATVSANVNAMATESQPGNGIGELQDSLAQRDQGRL